MRMCVVCGSGFEPSKFNPHKVYCGAKCKTVAWRAANPDKAAVHRAAEKVALKARPKSPVVRVLSAYHAGYCGCGKPHGQRTEWVKCPDCRALAYKVAAIEVAQVLHRARAHEQNCSACGALFCKLYGHTFKTCSQSCSDAAARTVKANGRSMDKARRRLAQVERVDVLKVLSRDGWHCYLCGIETPEAKRGTLDPDAPELEHVVPISRGGSHSYANCRCACRECNADKGNQTEAEYRARTRGGLVLSF